MTDLGQEVDQLFVDYFRDFGKLDLEAIVAYFHLPCMFITPTGVFVFSTASEVEGFWRPRFDDLRSNGFARTERSDASIKVLTDDTAIASSKATRYSKDESEMERRGAVFTVRKTDAGWKIVALVHHSPDTVIKVS
ncbi:MAG: nuclear transport factor 2 family protein [Chloroflexi bacterium]|nr:nuclear transport factor 2 family protein [Chloroflexota bacterium]MDA1270020.1 nuclear transport factor 2 family protein [Chloroflexota bacterium]